MNVVRIILDCDREYMLAPEDLPSVVQIKPEEEITVARIPNGTKGGNSSVAVIARMPDGRPVFIQMTMSNFLQVASAFEAAEGKDVLPPDVTQN